LFLDNADKKATNKKCKLCNFWHENQSHILKCRQLATIKKLIYEVSEAMGTSRRELMHTYGWLFNTNKEGTKSLNPTICALIRIYWRTVYRNLTHKKREKVKFNPYRVKQEILRHLMSRILAYQSEKQIFNMMRKYSSLQHILPKKAADLVSPLGNLNVKTGTLTIKNELKTIFKKYKVWTDFNLEVQKNESSAQQSPQH